MSKLRASEPISVAGFRIYLAHGRHVRCITLKPWAVGAACAGAFLIGAWLIGSTAFIVFNQEIREASNYYFIEKQRAYEDRIAALRRQVDEINSRQFLDQVAFEEKLEAVRRRQHALEERHAQMGGLLQSVSNREITIKLPQDGDEERRAEAADGIVTGSAWSPLLIGRPRPADQPKVARKARRSGGGPVGDLDDAVDRLWSQQDQLLASLESGLARTIEQLTAVPEAIGAPLPHFENEADSGGIGGPFVELRGADAGIPIEDQILRIERAVERVEVLERHVRRLPVRTPIAGPARITSRFGNRRDPFLGRPAMHTGIDFRASTGTPILATAAGRVIRAGRMGGYGNLVEIDHGGGYTTRYAHLSRINVDRDQAVAPGDLIGAAGSTGRSTGPHLHYETRFKGRPIDPTPFVKASELLPEGL